MKLVGYVVLGDTDDALLYYDGAISKWVLDGAGYTTENIATEDFVTSSIGSSESGRWSDSEIDQRFVRRNDAGDSSTNTTWTDWSSLIASDAIDRSMYTRPESYAGFIRSSNWSYDTPPTSGTANYSTSSNVANTVVERDSNQDIWCNILHGTATSAYYADLAEKYTCDENLLVGTVVGVMPGSEYEVEPFASDFMHGAIGVVSESPAFLMNDGSTGLPIALTGKVPVRVVGSVNKGDFLVPVEGGVARKGSINSVIDQDMKFATVLDDSLQNEERMVMCIIK